LPWSAKASSLLTVIRMTFDDVTYVCRTTVNLTAIGTSASEPGGEICAVRQRPGALLRKLKRRGRALIATVGDGVNAADRVSHRSTMAVPHAIVTASDLFHRNFAARNSIVGSFLGLLHARRVNLSIARLRGPDRIAVVMLL
jgi:hypothetical protein